MDGWIIRDDMTGVDFVQGLVRRHPERYETNREAFWVSQVRRRGWHGHAVYPTEIKALKVLRARLAQQVDYLRRRSDGAAGRWRRVVRRLKELGEQPTLPEEAKSTAAI